ncbi:MAG TPA: ABC transporter permease [Pirellulales bacterium]|nr:ABC transporter permease [Pirellulales bacterium]
MKKELGIFLLLAVVCTVTAVLKPLFLSEANLTNLANSIGQYGVFSIGMGFVIITGGIDLSVGSMLALVGVVLAIALRDWGWPWPLAVLLALIIPMALGWVHGFLITRMDLQPFIVTLCGLLIYRSMARWITHDGTPGFGNKDNFATLRFLVFGKLFQRIDPASGEITFGGIPTPFVILVVVAVVSWIALHRSVYGRYLFAVGKNEEAARFSGINTRRVIASSYILAGLLTGISAVMFAFYTNQVTPSLHGTFYEVYGIAAAVLGGCSLRGGEGSILGIVIGTTLLQVLRNLVVMLGIESSLEWAVMGVVILVGVLADQMLQKRAKKRLAVQRT